MWKTNNWVTVKNLITLKIKLKINQQLLKKYREVIFSTSIKVILYMCSLVNYYTKYNSKLHWYLTVDKNIQSWICQTVLCLLK